MRNIDLSKCWINGAPPPKDPDAADVNEHGSLIAFQIHVCRFLREWLPLAPVYAQKKPGVLSYADKQTVADEVNKALQTIGISMVVGLDTGTVKSAMKNAIVFSPFSFVVNIAESPLTNRGTNGSRITASRCAEHVLLCLAGASLGGGVCEIKGFEVDGVQGKLQTAKVTVSTSYTIIPQESLLVAQ